MLDQALLSAEPIDQDETPQPSAYLAVKLSDTDRAKLEPFIKNHLQQIEEALADIHGRFASEVNQFEGLMPGGDYPYPGAFRVNVPLTKKKVREIANRLKQAYLDSDPIWAIGSARLPDDLVSQIERGLDHQVDNELFLADDLSQAMFESVLHGAGVTQPCWAYQEDVHRDMFVGTGFDGVNPDSLADLFKFEGRFPDWKDSKSGRNIHSRLAKGEDVADEIDYRAPTINRPDVVHIPIKDVRAYPHLNSWEDLQQSPLYGYIKTHTRSELDDFARDGTIDEDQLGKVFGTDSTDPSPREQQEDYDILKATVRFKLDGDTDPVRYVVWYECDSHVIIRIRKFPWWLNQPDLIFYHIRQEEPGLFKRGIAWDLVDTHTAANVTFNLYLNGADMANSMRWYVKENSAAERHILNRRWSPHLPMVWRIDPNEAQSLATPTSHLGPLVEGFELIRRQSDEETQTSSLQSGRESPTDPNAPGNKTAMLLAQVEPNMKEYIRSLEPAYRQLGRWLVWMFYQGKRLGWIDEIAGFPDVPDDLLPEIAGQLSPRAILFEFDRAQRLQADNMVLGWVTKLAPQAVVPVLRKAISHVSSDWAKEADTLPLELPTPTLPPTPGQTPPGVAPPPGSAISPNGNGMPTNRMAEMAG